VTPLVLASASASRARMLTAAGVDIVIDPASIDEDGAKTLGLAPDAVADLLAEQKALAVSARRPDDLVLGADQVLVFENRLISKCRDMVGAKALLQALSGKEHALISAAALAKDGKILWRTTDRVRLSMRPLSGGFIDAYLAAEGEGLLSGVGCYRMEGRGAQLFTSVQGDFFSILGLPLLPLLAALREQGMLSV
jgi:septum formation protein